MQWRGQVLNPSLDQWQWESELLWLKIILNDLKIKQEGLMRLYCDPSALLITRCSMIKGSILKWTDILSRKA
jgi:hypothetical protein